MDVAVDVGLGTDLCQEHVGLKWQIKYMNQTNTIY